MNQDYNDENNGTVNDLTISKEFLKKTSKWLKIVAILTIISGVLACLGAFTTFGLSLIPGIINIILGVKLNNAKKAIDNYLRGDFNSINEVFDNIGQYFKIQGIFMIAGIVISILMVIAMVIFGFAAFNNMGPEMMY